MRSVFELVTDGAHAVPLCAVALLERKLRTRARRIVGRSAHSQDCQLRFFYETLIKFRDKL